MLISFIVHFTHKPEEKMRKINFIDSGYKKKSRKGGVTFSFTTDNGRRSLYFPSLRGLLKSKKQRPLLGIDFSTGYIKAVLYRHDHGELVLNKKTVVQLPSNTYDEKGIIVGPDAIIESLRMIKDDLKLPSNYPVAFNVQSGHSCIQKLITLPAMSQSDLDLCFPSEAENYLPFDINEIYMDFPIISRDEERRQMTVLLASIQKTEMDPYVDFLAQAGFSPKVATSSVTAVMNILEEGVDDFNEDYYCTIDVGHTSCEVVFYEEGKPTFIRSVDSGLSAFQLFKSNHPTASGVALSLAYDKVRDHLFTKIRSEMDLYTAATIARKSKLTIMFGGINHLEGLVNQVEQESDIPTCFIGPFGSSMNNPHNLHETQFFVAAGLARM